MNCNFKIPGTFLFATILASCATPVARFSINAEHKEAPATIDFINQSQNAETYLWNFGDGTESTEENVTHKYPHSGKYDVSLKAIKGKKSNTMTQPLTIDPSPKCLVEITTEYGVMIAELYDATPQHRDNFMKLAEEGYYNDLLFHRVIDGFMIQGG
ncbi:MAG: peptidylprolyl isomerase, partial [Saprospiraceae bacterium]